MVLYRRNKVGKMIREMDGERGRKKMYIYIDRERSINPWR